ncbi:MAG: alpha/beta hydrolase [Gemmatimonadota bacterium]|nr:alpha/beta hydrolase [Gemmatimonadota bacterium]
MRAWIPIVLTLAFAVPCEAQWAGRWAGEVEFRGDRWPIRFVIEEGERTARVDLPELLYVGEPIDVEAGHDTFVVELPFGLGAMSLTPDSAGLSGAMPLAGDSMEVRLVPSGPPPYAAREVAFESGPARLAGTLLVPEGTGPHPAVVVVHGSNVPGRERWAYTGWGDWFARRGVAALVWDKRGAGESTGPDWREADLEDLADDVLAALRHLADERGVDPVRVGAFGGSQAGWLIADAAARSVEVAFVALVSAPGVTPGEQELQSVEGRMRADQRSTEEIAAAIAHTRLWLAFAETGIGWEAVERSTVVADTADWGDYVQRPADPADLAWWTRNHAFDAAARWATLERPALFLYGGADPIVPPDPNARLVESATGGGRPGADVTIEVFDRADHRLEVPAGRGPHGRWSFPRIHPDALETLERWLRWRWTESVR